MEEVNENIKNECIERWGKENKCDSIEWFSRNYSEWIKSISLENREIIYKLLSKFEFYGHTYVNKGLHELYCRFIEKYEINNEETVYTYIKKTDSSLNSSVRYLVEYISINNISEKNCLMDIRDINDGELEYIKNIVLIDDYSGSGESIIKYIEQYYKKFLKKNIFILLISMSEGAKDNILNKFKAKDFNIYIEVINLEKKAFSKIDLNEEEVVLKRKEFEEISIQKGINKNEEIWGRNKTEALISFYNNTPNNTLGIFWKKTSLNNPLFPRNENSAPNWRKMKYKKKNRKLQNANNYRSRTNGRV